MFVPREINPKAIEWQDEIYRDGDYCIVPRKSGDYEVYKGRKMIAKTEDYDQGVAYIEMAKGGT